jgi:hypothetical protein
VRLGSGGHNVGDLLCMERSSENLSMSNLLAGREVFCWA